MAASVAVNSTVYNDIQDMDDILDDDGIMSDDEDTVVVENSPPLDLSAVDDEYFVVNVKDEKWVLVTLVK